MLLSHKSTRAHTSPTPSVGTDCRGLWGIYVFNSVLNSVLASSTCTDCTKLCSLVVLSSFFSTGGGAPLVPGGMEKSSAIGVAFFFRVHNTRTRFLRKKDAPRGLPKGRPHGASNTVNTVVRVHHVMVDESVCTLFAWSVIKAACNRLPCAEEV